MEIYFKLEVGSGLQLCHSGYAPLALVTITVTGQWDWDLWPVQTWLFHLSNYTSGGTRRDDSQSVNHCVDSSTANLSVHSFPAIIFHHDTHAPAAHHSVFSITLCDICDVLYAYRCVHARTHTHAPTHSTPTGLIPLLTGAHWFLTPATPMQTLLCSIISCSITQGDTAAGLQTKDNNSIKSCSPLQKHENTCLLFFSVHRVQQMA